MRNKLLPLAGVIVLALAATILLLRSGGPADAAAPGAETSAHSAEARLATLPDSQLVVYKSPTCGCCGGWVDHMRENGFEVATVDVPEYDALARKKAESGVPNDLGSCHTATLAGYTVEGHVPARVVRRLLRERPDVRGIAVPGMPIGSPGMEGPNPKPYDVIAFRKDGSRVVYETVYPAPPTSDSR